MKIFRALINRRILARVRSRYPLSLLCLSMLAGQILAAVTTTAVAQYSLIGFAIVVVIAGVASKKEVWLIVPALTGFLLTLSVTSEPLQNYPGEFRYLLEVTERPNRPKPNDLRIRVKVLGSFSVFKGTLEEIAHPYTGRSLICKTGEVPWKNISGVRQGDVLLGSLTFKPFRNLSENFGYSRTQLRRGISGECKLRFVVKVQGNTDIFVEARESFLAMFRKTFGNSLSSGLLLSILLGIRESIPNPVEEAFRITGLSHLLVFSGAQVVLIYGFAYWLILKLTLWLQTRFYYYHYGWFPSVASLMLTVFFVLFIGADKSSMRALIALCVGWCAAKLERGQGIGHAILGAATVLMIIWPGCMFEPGVQLTFAALVGIALGQSLGSSLWICPCVSLTTSVVSVIWFQNLSLLGFILNPVVVPLVSGAACTVGVVAVLLYVLGLDSGGVLFSLLSVPLGWLEEGIYHLQFLSWAAIPLSPFGVWCTVGSILVLLCLLYRRAQIEF